MNPWDLFTYAMVALLGGGAIVIFIFFMKDLGGILSRRSGGDGPE